MHDCHILRYGRNFQLEQISRQANQVAHSSVYFLLICFFYFMVGASKFMRSLLCMNVSSVMNMFCFSSKNLTRPIVIKELNLDFFLLYCPNITFL